MGGRWAGARELRHQLGRKEGVQSGAPRIPWGWGQGSAVGQPLVRLLFTAVSALDRAAAL